MLLRLTLLGMVGGSAFGLLFGLASLNRPVTNAVVFYTLCAVCGGLIAAVCGLGLRLRRRAELRRQGLRRG